MKIRNRKIKVILLHWIGKEGQGSKCSRNNIERDRAVKTFNVRIYGTTFPADTNERKSSDVCRRFLRTADLSAYLTTVILHALYIMNIYEVLTNRCMMRETTTIRHYSSLPYS
jgi:hypothetical protein